MSAIYAGPSIGEHSYDSLTAPRTGSLRTNLSRVQRREMFCEWAEWCREFSLKCYMAAYKLARDCSLNDTSRWVYFIRQGADGPIKIGVSDNVELRLKALQSANPHTLHCVVAIQGDATLEAALHEVFAPFRLHGEWFEPNGALIKLIEFAMFMTPTQGVVQESL